jgi:prophage antirepressor-like protein
MEKQNAIKLFNSKKVRVQWDDENEKWYFSIVDVVAILTESNNPQVYWRVLKKRLLEEGNQTVTNCNGLKMVAPDGKMRMTDVADTEQLLRLIQSIPSPKAEPFKLWL